MSGNERSFTWIDDSVDHSERDEVRATMLAKRWSILHNYEEQRRFEREFDDERDSGWEPDVCQTCGGDCFLGLDGPRNRRGELKGLQDWQVGIRCPSPNCEDGRDIGPIREAERRLREAEEDRRLELEIVEEKLHRIGARMMRPYEHWNEDEAYVQHMEEGRFGEYSS